MNVFLLGLLMLAAGAVAWAQVARRSSVLAGWLSALTPLALFFWLVAQAPGIGEGVYPEKIVEWVPQLGVALHFRLDGPGLLLSILITGIGSAILVYGGGYFKGSPQAAPFFGFVQFFMLAMLGMAAADDLLLLFVFWELTSLSSYLLIGLSHGDAVARKSALRALLVTGGGGLALLAGFLLLHSITGTFSLAVLQGQGETIRSSPFYTTLFLLIVLGAFTKSAQFPFHFWLPEAMAAPTPVSAYLHSATMVKAGVFLLAKFSPILGGTPLWHDTLTVAGAVTMILGGVFALAQTDLKRLLAYSTVSALGILVMLLGIGSEVALTAAMVFMVVHALYKGPLFMIAGVVDKATGTRNITVLQGLARKLPLLAFASALAAFSMSGLPPFVGFIGKELLYEAKMDSGRYSLAITCLGFAANAINVAVALKVGISPFSGRAVDPEINPKARTVTLLMGPLLLALAGVIIGLFPQVLGDKLIAAAVRDILHRPVQIDLKLWHGFSLLLGISVVTVIAGVLIYAGRDRVRAWVQYVVHRFPMRAASLFDGTVSGAIGAAGAITRLVQHGNLRLYVAFVVISLSALLFAALSKGGLHLPPSSAFRLAPAGVAVLMVVAALGAIRSRSTVMVVLAMGGIGYGVALLFAFFGAPDLALTQVLVETLTLVLFAIVLRRLPNVRIVSSPGRRGADLLIAAVAGAALVLALLAVRGSPNPPAERVSAEFSARSLPEAHGRNVVNVILVDFRALDTLGEICVLAIAGLGVAGLLLGSSRRNFRADLAVATPLFRTAAAWLSPILIFVSILLLFRGHNEPGGGFIGGLVAGSGLVLKRFASPDRPPHAERRSLLLLAAGMATALASTLPSVFLGKTFMQGVWAGSIWLPLVGKAGMGTPFLFDVGVYFVVVGATLLILSRLLRGDHLPAPNG
jgi:multicomponent Na+:H+ antiporter subunit A